MKKLHAGGAILGLALALTGCSSSPDMVGMWESTGPSSTAYFYDDGTCEGMMSVDIGGPMYCSVSESEQDGYYVLEVRQSENSATYLVQPDGDDHLNVFTTSGAAAFDLVRL